MCLAEGPFPYLSHIRGLASLHGHFIQKPTDCKINSCQKLQRVTSDPLLMLDLLGSAAEMGPVPEIAEVQSLAVG